MKNVSLFLSAISNNTGENSCGVDFLIFFFNVICVVTAGDLLSKKGEHKTYSIAKFCHRRSSSWKHCQSYKQNTRLRNFFFLYHSSFVDHSVQRLYLAVKGRKGKQAVEEVVLREGRVLHCSDRAWCWASCGLVTGFLLFPGVDKWVFHPGRREQYFFFPVTAQVP